MSHALVFDLLYEYDTTTTGITIPVVLSFAQEQNKTLANLDTGATFCIFKRDEGEALGLDIEKGYRQIIRTATEPFVAYGHYVSLFALNLQLDVMVYFAARYGLPRNVLGRRGWLDQIRLGLIEYEGKLYVGKYD
ncbi:MAG: hypothetical protein AB1757_21715 [Acidobacteriota bacterium]